MVRRSLPGCLRGVAVVLALLAATACEEERPPVAGSSAGSSAGSVAAPGPAAPGAASGQTASYGPVESFQSASPGYNTQNGQRVGLTTSSGNPNAREPEAAAAPGNMNALLNDVRNAVDSGGSAIVVITGHTDSQHSNTNNATLAEHRAFITAWNIADDLGRPVTVVADRSLCGSGACLVYQAHDGARANQDLGRFASAAATFTPGRAEPTGGFRGVDDLTDSRGGGGGSRPPSGCLLSCFFVPDVPPRLIDPDRPPVWSPPVPGVPETPSRPAPVIPDPFDPEIAQVRIVVDVPATLRAGGSLRPHELRVVSVDVLCDGEPCENIDAPQVGSLRAGLHLRSLVGVFDKCATRASTGCEFFLEPDPVSVRVTDGRLTSPTLVAGFFSPTPSRVFVYPELLVSELSVRQMIPVFVGGPDCDPADRACWDFLDGAELDLELSVVSTAGETFSRSGDRFFLERVVVGSVGS